MKSKFNLIILPLLLGMISFTGMAQNQTDSVSISSEQQAQITLSKLSRELDLSLRQQDQVLAILVKRAKTLNNLGSLTASEKREKVLQANAVARGKLKKILTEDQMDRYNSLREYLRKQREKKGKPQKLDEQLDF